MRLILFLVLILLTSTTLAAAQLAGNCSSASEIVLRRSGAEYVIQGSKVAAYPLRSDTGERLPNVSLQWDLTLLIERGKTWRWDRDSSAFAAEYISPDPNTPATLIRKALGLPCNDTKEPCYVDPFHVTNELTEIDCPGTRGACGPVLQHFSTSSLNCYQRRVINESFYGTRRESVITTFSLPGDRSTLGDAADFRFIAENHLVDDYVSYWGDSDGLQEHYVYEYELLHKTKKLTKHCYFSCEPHSNLIFMSHNIIGLNNSSSAMKLSTGLGLERISTSLLVLRGITHLASIYGPI